MLETRTLFSKIALMFGLVSVLGILVAPLASVHAESSEPVAPEVPPVYIPGDCAALFAVIAAAPPTDPNRSVLNANYIRCLNDDLTRSQIWQGQVQEYWYRRSKQINQSFEFKIKIALLGGVLNAMGYAAQRIAYETAQLILTGGQGSEPMFWNQPIGEWLQNVGEQSSSMFISELDQTIGDFTEAQFGKEGRISFCSKPNPLALSMSLSGVQPIEMMKPTCTLSAMASNFTAIADMVESGDALKIQKAQFDPNANDLAIGININNRKVQKELDDVRTKLAERQESQGMKPIMDTISWKLKYPSAMANESLKNMDPVAVAYRNQKDQESYMMDAYWQTGLEGIAFLTVATFANTMVVGILQRIFKQDTPVGDSINATPNQMKIKFTALQNADASGDAVDLYERQSFAKALGDYIVPNFSSSEDKDVLGELSTCVTPRGRWSCAMDQALAVAISAGTKDGALTVGRAAGIGVEGSTYSPNGQGVHADWELIPESDTKNNTDPACAQRAYCAGNLKKMRLARILPIGWELAANSTYNIKKNGKYVLLGEVIRNFYNCNDKGEIDKDHPWCHLIDPNWILTSPKYQCRAKGYGDTIMPGTGTRLEDCGDVVSCLGTNQNNECDKGYGYCLAERPVYRFDSKTCEPQFASCRTYSGPSGMVSYLRNSVDRGHCSEENMGCAWYATQRYVTSTKTADGLWVGTVTSGPRVYYDGTVKPCTAEGCSKVYRFEPGQQALNLVQNGSFESMKKDNQGSITSLDGWHTGSQCSLDKAVLGDNSYDNANNLSIDGASCQGAEQQIQIYPNRYYVLSFYLKSQSKSEKNTSIVTFYKTVGGIQQLIATNIAAYEDCVASGNQLAFNKSASDAWTRTTCKFVSPKDASSMKLTLSGAPGVLRYDAIQLEEGQNPTLFGEGVAAQLAESYLKIAPDEYQCTGNDETDNPACKRFARVCSQTDVGCQGYKDTEDLAAPEIPATLSTKDLCPAVCAGYGEYRKLASSFDLVRSVDPVYNDPNDDTVAYFIPSLAAQCSLAEVGCEAFTSLEGATSTGESVSYYNQLRSCEKPSVNSATFFTWEGSDVTGYQLKTWSLIKSDSDNSPKILLKGATLGSIKDPNTCNEMTWKKGTDPDCRQFYDKDGAAYYRYYSQTISSDLACALMRKSNSSDVDCKQTGGQYVAETKDCMYNALPTESNSCSAQAGGCRAYMGPTGRNAVAVLFEQFNDPNGLAKFAFDNSKVKVQLSKESVLVGDQSIKIESVGAADMDVRMDVPINTTSTLYRVSFWIKTDNVVAENANVSIDGQVAGSFVPDVKWKRFEFGPFAIKGTTQGSTTTAQIAWHFPAGFKAAYLDTIKLDQLNDTQFVIKDKWSIPAACDATYPENIPEPHAMAGCRAYTDRDGNTAFVRKFSSLCREQAIGCKAFIDSRGNADPYPKTVSVTGTPGPSKKGNNNSNNPADLKAKAYDEQFLGDWTETTDPYRYYYAIDDQRAQCDSSENMCRAFGKPIFMQTGLSLATTTYAVRQQDADIYSNQKQVYGFQTVLLKHDFNSYTDDNGNLNLACRKDELFCNRFQSGNVVEYFRDPGKHACEWKNAVQLKKNEAYNIMQDGIYSGWFRKGTSIPCYPEYLGSGEKYLLQFTGELRYAGWGAECPQDQSECAEFVDPNDTSDASQPLGRSYFMINSNKLDTRSCGGVVDPLAGCVLFNNKNISELQASSKATYAKIQAEHGAAQSPVDCQKDPENPNCKANGTCGNFVKDNILYACPGDYQVSLEHAMESYNKTSQACQSDSDCKLTVKNWPNNDCTMASLHGTCQLPKNDSNIVLKVKLDRECARWMGCRTGETVYDPSAQKYVNQCSQLELCEKNGSKNDDIFCAKFSDRTKEDLLSVGQFITPETYSSRLVGYGKLDYSGYTVPNQYLLPDIQPEPVGYQILSGDLKDQYRYDQRLVAEIPMSNEVVDYTDNNFKSLPAGYTLCQDQRTQRIGYRLPNSDFCILSVSGGEATAMSQNKQDLSKDIQQIYKEFAANNVSNQNALLQSAMPGPECQLFPEIDSPLPNQYVAKWNNISVPPTPEAMLTGFDGAKACVFGEDCSCSYRKARYQQNLERYYSLSGSAPAVGVCSGGKNDGSACVPGGYVPVDAKNRIMVSQQGGLTDNTCQGGSCVPIQDVVVMNGKYGYCIERDRTRVDGVSQSTSPCLTWSPATVLGGKYDLAHYSPTAGYLPPQGAGEYFCTSGANPQKLDTWSTFTDSGSPVDGWWGKNFKSPGKMIQFGFSRADVWTVHSYDDYKNVAIDGATNVAYEGNLDCLKAGDCPNDLVKGQSTQNMRYQCRRTSLCEGVLDSESKRYPDPTNGNDNGGLDANPSEGRWIMTGEDINSSYMEYFIPDVNSTWGQNEKYFDYHFGMFKFSIAPFAAGTACKWNPRWLGMSHQVVEDISKNTGAEFSCQNYLQEVQSASQNFYSKFSSAFPGVLSRDNEAVLKDGQETPVKLKCTFGPWGQCFYKYWETGFQNSNQSEFKWPFMTHKGKLDKFSFAEQSALYYAEECRSGQPYFGIRAVFQNINDKMNALAPDEARKVSLDGPWQFVGFWVTTCLPTKNRQDPGWMYLRMDVVTADVCKEVGQVIAPNTRESAAFADRVWSQGGFFLPVLGIRYSSRNEPFGSAIATGKIGPDPMLVGASTPLSDSALRAPTFIDSGVTVAPLFAQQNAWVPLTNLFARVYKVYRWDPVPVFSGNYACVKGSSKGKACTWNANAYQGLKDCGDYSTCDPNVDKETINQNWRCNTLSGVNRGMHCGDNNFPARNLDASCHNAAMSWKWNEDLHQDEFTPLLSSCVQGNDASFTYPLDAFGSLGVNTDLKDKVLNAWANAKIESCGTKDIGQGKTMTFRVIKCLNRPGWSAAYPMGLPSLSQESCPSQFTDSYALWGKVVSRMRQGISNLNLTNNTANCSSAVVAGSIPDILLSDPAFQDPKIQKALNDLVKNGTYPNQFELGPWSDDRIDQVRVNKCDALAVNAGERCGVPSTSSEDCPQKVVACSSSDYAKLKAAFVDLEQKKQCGCGYAGGPICMNNCKANVPELPCGKCVADDPFDNYKSLYPDTGYCKGFNPLARCRVIGGKAQDTDCQFTAFEFWGAHDDGTGKGTRWATATSHLIVSKNEINNGVGVGPTVTNPTARLPLPLFNTNNGLSTTVPKEFSDPAMLSNFTDGKADFTAVNQNLSLYIIASSIAGAKSFSNPSNPLYPLCPNKAYLWTCVQYSSAYGGLLTKSDFFKACVNDCNASAFMIPNSYASNFMQMPDKGPRTAAVAPFAVNPLIRTINSIGTIVRLGENQQPVWTGFYALGQYFVSAGQGAAFGKAAEAMDVLIIPAVGKFTTFITSINSRSIVVPTHLTNGYYNDTFPWDPNKIFFKSIFPLIEGSDYGYRQITADFNGTYAKDLYWLPWDKVWTGYGMSSALFDTFNNYITAWVNNAKDPNSNKDWQDKKAAFEKLAATDMETNFFSQTGWGAFIKPSDARLQLYPGAIPAAVLRDQNNQLYPEHAVPSRMDEKFTVYVPGHCEPPVGGTDSDSFKGKPQNVVSPADGVWKGIPVVGTGGQFEPNGVGDKGRFQTAWNTLDFQSNADNLQKEGLKNTDLTVWTQAYLLQKSDSEPTSISIDSDLWGEVKNLRTTCRCVGGRLDGTVQESQADCNKDLPEALNPDKMAKKNPLYDPNNTTPDAQFCKLVTKDDGVTPIKECLSAVGKQGDPDPDKDNNACTHGPGYIPRGDVCADDRSQCLVTYNLSNPVSTNFKTISANDLPAPSATDVTTGLDTYTYLTGGRTNKDGREYSSWYRPRPPRVAAPDTSKVGQSSSAAPISAVDAFSLDGRPEGLSYYGGGQGLSTIRFYAWAAHEQGPVKSVIIDWGDGTVQNISDTQMKNQKPLCNTDRECEYVPGLACSNNSDCPPGTGACLPMGNCTKQSYKVCHADADCGASDTCVPRVFFGNSTEACRQGYLEYQHVYKCDSNQQLSDICDQSKRCENEPDVVCTTNAQCRPNEKCVSGLAPSGGCLNTVLNRCRYTPRVMVMDNWGWCTGDCSQQGEAQPGGASVNTEKLTRHPFGGCWDGSSTKLNTQVMLDPLNAKPMINECMPQDLSDTWLKFWLATYRPWVVYNGSVEVGYADNKLIPVANVSQGSNSIYKMQNQNFNGLQIQP